MSDKIVLTEADVNAVMKGSEMGADGVVRVDGVAISATPEATFPLGSGISTLTLCPTKLSFTPHPHSPEGRVDRLEETMVKLLKLMIEGEMKQEEDTGHAAMGVLAVMFKPKEAKSYPERLAELLKEYETYMKEVRDGDIYRCANPYAGPFPKEPGAF